MNLKRTGSFIRRWYMGQNSLVLQSLQAIQVVRAIQRPSCEALDDGMTRSMIYLKAVQLNDIHPAGCDDLFSYAKPCGVIHTT